MAETINHSELSEFVISGVIKNAHVVGQENGWFVTINYGTTSMHLVSDETNQIKLFKKLDSLVEYLKGIGIAQFDVDASLFKSKHKSKYYNSHEASVHYKWFQGCVEKALIFSSKPNSLWIDHDDVMAMLTKKKARLFSQKRDFYRKKREIKHCK